MTTTATSTHNHVRSATAKELPDWLIGTRNCQLSLAEGVSIFREGDRAILKLTDSKSTVEFEVDSAAVSQSLDQEKVGLEKYIPDFKEKGLLASNLFRLLSAHPSESFKIKQLHIESDNINIEGSLAEHARVTGRTKNSIISLQGHNVSFKDLSVEGSSTLILACADSTFENVNINSDSSLSGDISGISLKGSNNIKAFADCLKISHINDSTSTEQMRQSFKGARISNQLVGTGVFNSSNLREYTQSELDSEIEKLNKTFLDQHFSNLPVYSNGKMQLPKILASSNIPSLEASKSEGGNIFKLMAPLETERQGQNGQVQDQFVLAFPDPKQKTTLGGPSLAIKTTITEGQEQIEGEVPFQVLEGEPLLYSYWLVNSLRVFRGGYFSSQQIQKLLNCARENLRKVA